MRRRGAPRLTDDCNPILRGILSRSIGWGLPRCRPISLAWVILSNIITRQEILVAQFLS